MKIVTRFHYLHLAIIPTSYDDHLHLVSSIGDLSGLSLSYSMPVLTFLFSLFMVRLCLSFISDFA